MQSRVRVWHRAPLAPGIGRGVRRGHAGPPRVVVSLVAVLLVVAVMGVLLLRPATPAYSAPPAPDFTLPVAANGHGKISLRALRGRPVMLNFFLTTCIPCRNERPDLRAAAQTYRKKGVVVLGLASTSDSRAAVQAFAAAGKLHYPMLLDNSADSVEWQYHIGSYPTTLFIDARGRVQAQVDGPIDAQSVRDGLAAAGAVSCATCGALERPTFESATTVKTASSAALKADFVYHPAPKAPSFALPDQNGAIISPATLRGKVVALMFLSALCTEQCPLAGKTLTDIHRLLGKDGARLSVVVISADPEADTPAATRRFAKEAGWTKQGVDWHYLTGPRAILQRIWRAYGADVEPPAPIFKNNGQGLIHDATLYLIDPRGQLRAFDHAPFLASQVTSAARYLLAQHS